MAVVNAISFTRLYLGRVRLNDMGVGWVCRYVQGTWDVLVRLPVCIGGTTHLVTFDLDEGLVRERRILKLRYTRVGT
jgi:hypothetical protein